MELMPLLLLAGLVQECFLGGWALINYLGFWGSCSFNVGTYLNKLCVFHLFWSHLAWVSLTLTKIMDATKLGYSLLFSMMHGLSMMHGMQISMMHGMQIVFLENHCMKDVQTFSLVQYYYYYKYLLHVESVE